MKSTHSTIYLINFEILHYSLSYKSIIPKISFIQKPNKHRFLHWIKSHDFTRQEIA